MSTIENKAGVQRRFGFVAILWWVAFAGATFDAIQHHNWSVLRVAWIVVALLLGTFFTFTWWKLKKGSDL